METTIERVIGDWPAIFDKRKNIYYIRKQLHDNGIFFIEFRNDQVIVGISTDSNKDIDLLNLTLKDLNKVKFSRDEVFKKAVREANRMSL